MKLRIQERPQLAEAIDRFVLLCATTSVAEGGGRTPGKVLLQKILFQVRAIVGSKGFEAPHYAFHRHKFGPFSPELAEDVNVLQVRGLLGIKYLLPSTRGEQIVEAFRPEIAKRNHEFFGVLDAEARKRAKWTGERAKKEAYAMRVCIRTPLAAAPGFEMKEVALKDVPEGLQFNLGSSPARTLDMDEDLLGQLAVDLAMSPNDIDRSRTYSKASTAGVYELLAP